MNNWAPKSLFYELNAMQRTLQAPILRCVFHLTLIRKNLVDVIS
jgi:hypothetical protein